MLTTVGLLHLRMGENFRAFDFLGSALTHDPTNSKVRAFVPTLPETAALTALLRRRRRSWRPAASSRTKATWTWRWSSTALRR